MKARALVILLGLAAVSVGAAPMPKPPRIPPISEPPKHVCVPVADVEAELEAKAIYYETLATEFFTYEVSPELNALLRGRAAAFRESIRIVRQASKPSGPKNSASNQNGNND